MVRSFRPNQSSVSALHHQSSCSCTMDSATTAKAFKYNISSQQPIFNIIETPFHRTSFSHNYTITDASFPSFLSNKESDQFPSPVVKCVSDDTELNVFDAQKYFSENNTDTKDGKGGLQSSQTNFKPVSQPSDAVWRVSSASSSVDGFNRNFRVRSFNATPTASSEASWNSQTGLLSNPPGSIPVSLRNIPPDHSSRDRRSSSSAVKWLFCRKCPCSGKKSVQVDEGSPEHKTSSGNEDDNNNNKADFYQKKQVHRTHDQEKIVEKTSIMSSQRSPAITDHELAEIHHQKVSSNITSSSRLSPQNHFMSNGVLQQRVLASGRPFTDGVGAFSFPILNPAYPPKPEQKGLSTTAKTQTSSPQDDPPRVSLEVFQPSEHSILRKSMDDQRVVLGPKAHGRTNFTFQGTPTTRGISTEDDVASDASSDLFEIESFSTQTAASMLYHRRDSLDEAATFNARRLASASNGLGNSGNFYAGRRSLDEPMTPTTENYAPSEASVDWSVTTAEGFDRASMTNFSISASEIEDFSIPRHRLIEVGDGGDDNYSYHGGKKKGNGLLLSCRHERAVSVGPHPIKCMPEDGPPLPLISTSGHVNIAASRPPKPNVPPLAKGHSARLSLAFAT